MLFSHVLILLLVFFFFLYFVRVGMCFSTKLSRGGEDVMKLTVASSRRGLLIAYIPAYI